MKIQKYSSILVAALVISLVVTLFTKEQSPKLTDTPQKTLQSNEQLATSRYIEYSPEAFSAHSNSRRVLYFYANWCSTCLPANADFLDHESQIPENVTVFKVNYNDSDTVQVEKQLAKDYQITYQHTFVQVDKSGQEITRWNGGKLSELIMKLK